MSKTEILIKGPKCFGTMQRKSFVDERDDDIPGPGAHNAKRIDKYTVTQCKFGKDTQRNTFLQTPSRKTPSPCRYQPHFDSTLYQGPLFTFPKSSLENPKGHKDNRVSAFDDSDVLNKSVNPQFSFGYYFERDYSTSVPAANAYSINKKNITKQYFNKTQRFFTKSKRPLPYGQQYRYPGSGAYDINGNKRTKSAASNFGTGQKNTKPKIEGSIPAKFYEIAKNLKQTGKGWTLGPFYEHNTNKEKSKFPGPNIYNPKYVPSKKRIITLSGKRSQLWNKEHIKNPSPQNHNISQNLFRTNQSLSFPKQSRDKFKPKEGPGPAQYHLQQQLLRYNGYMGQKIKQLEKFITPSSCNYYPYIEIVKPNSPNIVNYLSHRCDFSKSVTGVLGPGKYEINNNHHPKQLGKMSKSLKFVKNYNKNPGPGFYEIPTMIGKLPKYYTGQKKMTEQGYSTFTLEFQEKFRMKEQKNRQRQKLRIMKEEEQTKKREEFQLKRIEELAAKKKTFGKETDQTDKDKTVFQ